MSEEENVKVAVRVRPFNSREKERNAQLIVQMEGGSTSVIDPENPKNEPRKFTFDYSYWSFDGCKQNPDGFMVSDTSQPNGKKFCDQKKVFNDLGLGVLKNAWDGYNSTLFAYGQTGSGKSFSVIGYGVNKGIVPQFSERLFQDIDGKKGDGVQYEVTFSMLEIYMEEVRDLLNPKSFQKGGMKIRQHPKKGFYVEQLSETAVASYNEIEKRMEEGTTNRTVASTNMNATSSRAHTIVGLKFLQKSKNPAGQETVKSSMVNLVDLAGSERADSTGATGDRLKEGAAINTSLSALGNVIAALAEQSEGKAVKIPYRDSVLTKLLMNALGGNSKTLMVAAISPADINYEETLSTLRYADRAKQIKCKAVVNEDPTEKLIRELQEENEKLKAAISGKGISLQDHEMGNTEGMTEAEKAAIRKEMQADYAASVEENKRQMEEMKKDFEEKLKQSRETGDYEKISEYQKLAKTTAHISNLNMDAQLCAKIVHFVDLERETVGNRKGTPSDIPLIGPSILEEHAVFTREDGKYYLDKMDPKARVLINGLPLTGKTQMHHNDRLLFGTSQYFIFIEPLERDASKTVYPNITFEMMTAEISEKAGFDMNKDNKSKEDALLQDELSDILPGLEEANAISADMDRKRRFEVVIMEPELRGELTGKKRVFVKALDLETDLSVLWAKEEFMNRRFLMREMFNKFEDNEDWKVPQEKDPFYIDYSQDVLVGSIKLPLVSLSYKIEIKEQLEMYSYQGKVVGVVNMEIIPCNAKGNEFTDPNYAKVNPDECAAVSDPKDLIGQDLHLVVKLNNARGIHKLYKDSYAKFLFYTSTEYISTPRKEGENPDWNFKKQLDFPKASAELIKYLECEAIMIQVWAKFKEPKKKTVNTMNFLEQTRMAHGAAGAGAATLGAIVDPNKIKMTMELQVAKMRAEKAETKINNAKRLVEIAELSGANQIPVSVLKQLLTAPNTEAEKILQWKPKTKRSVSSSSESDDGMKSKEDKKKKPKDMPKKEEVKNKKDEEKHKKGEGKDNKKDGKESSSSSTCSML